MVYQAYDTVMSPEPFQEFDFIGIALICFGIRAIQSNPLQSVDRPSVVTEDRIDLGRATSPQSTNSFVWDPVDLIVS